MKKAISILVTLTMLLILGIAPVYAEQPQDMPAGGMPGGRGGRPMENGETPPELPEGMEGMTPPERPEGEEGMTPPERPEGTEGMTPPQGGGRGGQGQPMGEMPTMLDSEGLQEAIAALAESDEQTEATTLLASYIAALEAERTTMESGRTGGGDMTAMENAKTAVEEARTALEAALSILGIDITAYALLPEHNMDGVQNILQLGDTSNT